MRYLGIDFGTKRIGLAISDELGMIAAPLETISTDGALVRIASVIAEKGVEEIVVGRPRLKPLLRNGSPDASSTRLGGGSSMEQELQEFVGQLSLETFLPVHMQNEEFSSVFADQFRDYQKPRARQTKKDTGKKKDESAAAVILQRFLDKKAGE